MIFEPGVKRNFNWDCETRGSCYVEHCMADWTPLNNCFGGKIRASDIDGVVEVNGHLLILEWKPPAATARPEDWHISTGQRLLLERNARLHGGMSIVIWGDTRTSVPQHCRIWYPNGVVSNHPDCDWAVIQERAESWHDWALKPVPGD